jgi:hypothetical protein
MKKLSILSGVLLMTAAAPLAAYSTVPVETPLVFTLDEYTGTDSQVILSVTGAGTRSVTVDVSLVKQPVADIRGVFFSYDGNLTGLKVSGSNVTSWAYSDTGGIFNLANDVNMHGESNKYSFDGGVEIGTKGIGKDDIQSTSFMITADQNIVFTDFGARLQSVFDGSKRNGSSKLYGLATVDSGGDLGGQGDVVPEPASVALMGIGAVVARAIQSLKKTTA